MTTVGPYTLDAFQERALQRARKSLTAYKRSCLVAPTGAGKSVIGLAVMFLTAERRRRVGFIASGRQLIFQIAEHCQKAGLDYTVLMSNSGYEYSAQSPVQIISKDTLDSKLSKDVPFLPPDLFIVDEADVAISARWQAMLSLADYVLGLTATPVDQNGRRLPFYADTIEVASYSELIGSGRLVDIPQGKVFSPYRPDLEGAVLAGADYSPSWLSDRMNRDKLVGDIVTWWQQLADRAPTIVHCVDVAHTVSVCEAFNGSGIRAEYIEAGTDQEERERIFDASKRGAIDVIVNCQTLTRGFDAPWISCCVLAKPTKRLRVYLQMVGRVLRSDTGKPHATLIDHAGAVYRHGWPTEDRDWELADGESIEVADYERRTKKKREPYCCPKCAAMWESGTTCPNCGFKHQKRGQMATTLDGKLIAVKRAKIKNRGQANDLLGLWRKILGISAARARSYASASGWFKSQTGKWPEEAGVGPVAAPHQRKVLVGTLWPGFRRRKQKT